MTAVRIAADLSDRIQVVKLTGSTAGVAALGLWTVALSWTHDQRPIAKSIPKAVVKSLGGSEQLAELLVRSGLWFEANGEYEPVSHGTDGDRLWWREPDGRQPILLAVRNAVFARDGRRCVECSATEDLTLDHIYPWSLGGPDTVENLRVLCRSCNSRKGAKV